jgi:AsmA protein
LKLDDSTLKGDLAINDFAGPDVQFGLGVDQLNADRYLAPEAAAGAPVTPEAAAAGAAQLPVETLRKLKIKGELLVGSLQYSGAKMQNVKLSIGAAGGRIVAKPVAAALYNGTYDGAINIDATQKIPVVGLVTNLSKVNIEPLLFDITGERSLAGTANLNFTLQATGNNTKAMKSSLSGPVKFLVQNGVYRGIDVASILAQIEVMLESKRPPTVSQGGETKFQTLSGTIQFTNGIGMNNDLLLDGSGFKITGDGMVANLNDDTMKYDAKVAVDSGTAQRGEETYNLGNYAVPIRCRGKLGANACKPDAGDIVAEIGKGAVKKEIGKQLEKAVGGEAGEALKKLFKF